MSDEHDDERSTEPVEDEHLEPGRQHDRVPGDAATAPAAQPRESDSDTTA